MIETSFRLRSAASRARLAYLTAAREVDPEDRRRRFRSALIDAWAHRPHHLLLTGDLTEDGTKEQFELLAQELHESPFDPHRVTLVPGNHDFYAHADYPSSRPWAWALRGPLGAFAATSALGEPHLCAPAVAIVPISTAVPQTFLKASGRIDSEQSHRLHQLAADGFFRRRSVVVAQHHPPMGAELPLLNWIDGIDNPEAGKALLDEHVHLSIVHGHTHRRSTRTWKNRSHPQVFSAPAVLDGPGCLRMYSPQEHGLAEDSVVGPEREGRSRIRHAPAMQHASP